MLVNLRLTGHLRGLQFEKSYITTQPALYSAFFQRLRFVLHSENIMPANILMKYERFVDTQLGNRHLLSAQSCKFCFPFYFKDSQSP